MNIDFAATLVENVGDATTGAPQKWPGGVLCVTAEGTVTVAVVQSQTRNGAWVPVDGLSFDAAAMKSAVVPAGPIRAVVTTGSAVYMYALRGAR